MYKAFKLVSFKALDEKQGTFEAIVAVFGNVDRAAERILRGAFTQSLADWQVKGRPIPVIFSHEWNNLDAHIGKVLDAKEVEHGLYVKGQLEMDEAFAARVYKKMSKGTLAQFSFAYDVIESVLVDQGEGQTPRYVTDLKVLDLLEVGPTLVGMNPDTQLIGVKKALASHKTATVDTAWDGAAATANTLGDQPLAYYRRIFAWADPEGDPGVKGTYKFPHHEVASDGTPGAANVKACVSAIGALNGARTPTTIPDEDKQGVWNHVAKHMRDAEVEPGELKGEEPPSMRLFESKQGARHSQKDVEALQTIHDLAVGLGAKCGEPDGVDSEDADQGEGDSEKGAKHEGPWSSMLAARLTLIELES